MSSMTRLPPQPVDKLAERVSRLGETLVRLVRRIEADPMCLKKGRHGREAYDTQQELLRALAIYKPEGRAASTVELLRERLEQVATLPRRAMLLEQLRDGHLEPEGRAELLELLREEAVRLAPMASPRTRGWFAYSQKLNVVECLILDVES